MSGAYIGRHSTMGSDEWILDSGAPFHLTSDRHLLHELEPLETHVEFVTGPDGKLFTLGGNGSVQTEKFNIPRVLYVPDMGPGVNIVSLSTLYYEHQISAAFGWDHCTLALASGKTAGRAVLRDGRYVLQYLIIGKDADATLHTALQQPKLEKITDQERSEQQELPLDDEAASSQAKQAAAAKQRVLDRFGLSRFNWRPDAPIELPIEAGISYYAAIKGPYHRNVFILDSGATHHMVPDGTLLDPGTYIESTDERFPGHIIRGVHVADGTLLPVAGIGNITEFPVPGIENITKFNQVTLENVLLVPGLPANLVSQGQLMEELSAGLEDQLRGHPFAQILDGSGVPELQIHNLALQIGINLFPNRYVVNEPHPMTIGGVQVGCISVDVNRLYHLHELRPCPAVNLVAHWGIREAP